MDLCDVQGAKYVFPNSTYLTITELYENLSKRKLYFLCGFLGLTKSFWRSQAHSWQRSNTLV